MKETEELRRRIMEVLEYDPETGLFRWKAEGPGRKQGWFTPAVHVRAGGRRRIFFDGVRYDAADIAWMAQKGVWPENRVRERVPEYGLIWSNLFRLTMKPKGKETDEHFRKRVMEVIEYDPSSGLFRWKVRLGSRSVWGWIKGSPSNGYFWFSIFKREIAAHSLAWLIEKGVFPKNEIDHENGNRGDNRMSNLRDVTHSVNCRNTSIPSHNKSGFCGVSFDRTRNKWLAHAKINGKLINLGRYVKFEDAVIVRMEFNRKNGFHENHGRNPVQ